MKVGAEIKLKVETKELSCPDRDKESSCTEGVDPDLEVSSEMEVNLGVSLDSGAHYTDSGAHYTDSGGNYTDSRAHYTDYGAYYTESGAHYTESGAHYTGGIAGEEDPNLEVNSVNLEVSSERDKESSRTDLNLKVSSGTESSCPEKEKNCFPKGVSEISADEFLSKEDKRGSFGGLQGLHPGERVRACAV